MKFRKKPVTVEAEQFWPDKKPWPTGVVSEVSSAGISFRIHTLEGVMIVRPGDWIITGVNGERYPCKPDIFEKTYDTQEVRPKPVPNNPVEPSPVDEGKKPPKHPDPNLPCPFCGSNDIATSDVSWYRKRKKCLACGAIGPTGKGAYGARDKWNNRIEAPV